MARRQEAGQRQGERGADAKERGVERDIPALRWPGDAIRKQAQARHIGRGNADPEQHLEGNGAGESFGEKAEAGGGRGGEHAAGEVHLARVHAIGERSPERHRGDIPGEEHAAHDARLGVRHAPLVAQLRQQRGVGREAQHRQDVGGEQQVNRVQRFLKLGLRFSRKAAMPSFWSASANCEWNRRRSNSTPSASELS